MYEANALFIYFVLGFFIYHGHVSDVAYSN